MCGYKTIAARFIGLFSAWDFDDVRISACCMKENDWLLSIEGLYEQTPAHEYFQALEDT